MVSFGLLRRDWKDDFALVNCAEERLLISSPFVSSYGIDFLVGNIRPTLRQSGRVTILTDLSPQNIYQGSTDPAALKHLTQAVNSAAIAHLPRLHAKVYVADDRKAIVTSGNLSAGGLRLNYEYGVVIDEPAKVFQIRQDVEEYATLGAQFSLGQLTAYCETAERVRSSFQKQLTSVRRALRHEFEREIRSAENNLIRLKLAGTPVTTVFEKTILYLLERGPLATHQMQPLVEAIHPDLCDNTVDRVIDGLHYGRKWKHSLRSAQSHLKSRGLIELSQGKWRLKFGRTQS
jgi:hypothetical protein